VTRYRRQFGRIARRLTPADIQCGVSSKNFNANNLFQNENVKQNSDLLLGTLSKQGIMKVLDAFGFLEILEKLGLSDISLELDTEDPFQHRLKAFSGSKCSKSTICELVIKQGPFHFREVSMPDFPSRIPDLLQIEWILLQNPKKKFDETRPPLPGQNHPGLGMGDRVMELLIIMAQRLRLEGIVNKPCFFHTAFMFTKEFYFVNPEDQATIYAISKGLLSKYSFYTVSWAAYFNCIYNTISGKELVWNPDYLFLPLSKDFIKYFRSRQYSKKAHTLSDRKHFDINRGKLIDLAKQSNVKLLDI
jgi:hypothetical protein